MEPHPGRGCDQESKRPSIQLRPSVGTWYQCLPRKNSAFVLAQAAKDAPAPRSTSSSVLGSVAEEPFAFPEPQKPLDGGGFEKMEPAAWAATWDTAVLPLPPRDFRQLASVGTWLQPRFEDGIVPVPATRFAAPIVPINAPAWEASFDDFGFASPSAEAPAPGKATFEKFDTAIETSSTAAEFEAQASLPSRRKSSEPCQLASPVGSPFAGFASFKLAPPPSPNKVMSVGSPITVPCGEIVVLEESLEEQKRAAAIEAETHTASLHEELLGTNRAEDDDQSCLLGDDAPSQLAQSRNRAAPDGVDSASDTEDEGAHIGNARTAIVQQPPRPKSQHTASQDEGPELLRADGPGTPVREESPQKPPESGGGGPVQPTPSKAAAVASPESQLPTLATTSQVTPCRKSGQQHSPSPETPLTKAADVGGLPSPSSVANSGTLASESPKSAASIMEADNIMFSALDKFFSDSKVWPQVEKEVASTKRARIPGTFQPSGRQRMFKVQVPKPYPGVQYRKSKHLDDRYMKYAANNATVVGTVEEGGHWLKLAENMYLPMRVGAVDILEPKDNIRTREPPPPPSMFSSWFSCCTASVNTDAEVVISQGQSEEETQLPAPSGRAGSVSTCRTQESAKDTGYRNVNTKGDTNDSPGGKSIASQADQGAGIGRSFAPPARSTSGSRITQEPDSPGSRRLPESLCNDPLSNLDQASRHFAEPSNPFADTERTQSTSRRTTSQHRPRPDRSGSSPTLRHEVEGDDVFG